MHVPAVSRDIQTWLRLSAIHGAGMNGRSRRKLMGLKSSDQRLRVMIVDEGAWIVPNVKMGEGSV